MPQLQINQGPQDALLYDNSRSYFTNVGYVRTSNFQLELRDVDSQNTPNLGTTVQFVIPKAADLLGPCDLVVELKPPKDPVESKCYAAWVESVGFAMIERITFSVGSHDIETIYGEQLNIINELMKTDTDRLGTQQILKTGRPAVEFTLNKNSTNDTSNDDHSLDVDDTSTGRVISHNKTLSTQNKKLIVPLGLFFTKHPSQYFPLAAIAGANDVRIAIKFRTVNELVQLGKLDYKISAAGVIDGDGGSATETDDAANEIVAINPSMPQWTGSVFDTAVLRCHYVHVTGPEATTLMNKEHVRLLKLWTPSVHPVQIDKASDKKVLASIDLSFLHPVQELIITIRKQSDLQSSTSGQPKPNEDDMKATGKNYFAYHGSGKMPNLDHWSRRVCQRNDEVGTGLDTDVAKNTVTVHGFKLTLNGQERHPSLANSGLDRNYLMNRLMPMLHSNTSHIHTDHHEYENTFATQHLSEMMDRKEIYVYPFALNPESANPSGAVNFSKVSHAKLSIEGTCTANGLYQIDVYGVHYNWLQIKDGRALTSFA